MRNKRVLLFALVFLFVVESLAQIPNVYEFCSALMTERTTSQSTSCPSGQCHGRMGKRGPAGIRGPPGVKGNKGEQGTCDRLEERQRQFEEKMQQKFDFIPKLLYCSLGMMNGDIPDEAITASSEASYIWASFYARLNERVKWSGSSSIITDGAWCTNQQSNAWIQVDLGRLISVAGVVTQGRPKNHWGRENWVKTFKISCGEMEGSVRTIKENGSDKIFVGNNDKDTKVINKFPSAMTCRYVRLHPLTWNMVSPWVGPCLRMELLRGECFDLF